MEMDNLSVSSRSETGKGPNRRLRAQGLIPAVIYGTGHDPVMVSLDNHELGKILSKANAETNLFSLNGEGVEKDTTVVIREIQRDPLTRRFIHIDLFRVRMDQEGEFEVPVHSTGTPVGVREGGVLETHLRSVIVRCLPKNLPTEITTDISELQVNETHHVSDLKLPANVSLVTDGEETLFAVHVPRTATEEETGTEEETDQQPEVIGKENEESSEKENEG